MYSLCLFLTAAALGFSKISQGIPSKGPPVSKGCATDNWPGWSGVKHAFVFGDSYTQTGFNNTLGPQPTIGNPLGNPPYPGFTASNGPNWIDFLTVEYNASLLLTYNMAFGGATVDSSLVAPFEPTVLSVADQVLDEFFPSYASSPSIAPWTSEDTLFAVFIGINDVGNSYFEGLPATTTLNNMIFDIYSGLVQMLYSTGARNFLFLNVPPVDRSPLTQAEGSSAIAQEAADLAAFNSDIASMAATLKKTHTDANVFTFDTNSLFTEVLDNPKSFPQTSLYKNTTNFCVAYENGTPAENTFDASCGVPVNEYFWLNSLHPTYPMHDVLAQQISLALGKGPNVC